MLSQDISIHKGSYSFQCFVALVVLAVFFLYGVEARSALAEEAVSCYCGQVETGPCSACESDPGNGPAEHASSSDGAGRILTNLFDTTGFPPRWHCGTWSAALGWLHIISDLLIWLAYVAIPIVLLYFLRRRGDLPFKRIFFLFGAFIIACGTTHLIEAIIFWWPIYRFSGVVKLFTAVVSLGTVWALIRVVPQALAMHSPQELEREVQERTNLLNNSKGLLEEQKNVYQDALKEIENQKLALDEHAIVAITDTRGDIIYVNDKFCEISQYAREELLGQNHRIINSGYHPREFFHKLWRTIAHGEIWQGEIRNRAKDGSYYWVDTTIVPFRNPSGRITQYVAVRTDVTVRKQIEMSLQELNQKLEQKNNELEQYVYTVSHDLKSPLVTVKGFVGLLQRDIEANNLEQTARDLDRISGATDTMYKLLTQVLELSRVGHLTINRSRISVVAVVEEVRNVLSGPLLDREICLKVEPDVPDVHADRIRFLEIILNLVENAIKYMGDQKDPHIVIRGRQKGDWGEITVQDNGMGIDPVYHDKIFGLFEQLDPECEGTGVGLAFVRRIVEVHGGTIRVESKGQGKGSSFIFTLPSARELSHGNDVTSASAGTAGQHFVG